MDANREGRGKGAPNSYFLVKWLISFAFCGIMGFIICALLSRHAEESMLAEEKENQAALLYASREAAEASFSETRKKILSFASSEAPRQLLRELAGAEDAAKLRDPDYLRVEGDNIRQAAEKLSALEKLLAQAMAKNFWPYALFTDSAGRIIASRGNPPPRFAEWNEIIKKATESGEMLIEPPRSGGQKLLADIACPVFENAKNARGEKEAVFMAAIPLDGMLRKTFKPFAAFQNSIAPRLVIPESNGFSMLAPGDGKILMEPVFPDFKQFANMPFERRPSLVGKKFVYSSGIQLKNPPCLFVAETPASLMESRIGASKNMIYVLGALACFILSLGLAWLWKSREIHGRRAGADRLAELSETTRAQQALLDSINTSLGIGLLLLDSKGAARMCNQAFLNIWGDARNVPASTPLREIMPRETADAILRDMSLVNDMGRPANVEIAAPRKDGEGRRVYRASLFPATGGEKMPGGLGGIALFQDITEFRRNAKLARERQTALLAALARAIESVDPNLVGHSEKLERLSELLGRSLRLEENELETLRIAARLSQVGKLFVPRELLTKREALTPEEMAEVRRAPEYADKILANLHFDLPVRETARMIGERLDGSGKPLGLMGSEITISGRVLAVANAFIAMTSPRSWRKGGGMGIAEAIAHLRSGEGFDQDVVNTLASVSIEELGRVIGVSLDNRGAFGAAQ